MSFYEASAVSGRWCVVVLIVLSPMLVSCAVGMAASGTENPDLMACTVGAPRYQIEREVGPPVDSKNLDGGGFECVYEYEIGNEPSAGRAVGHATMDVLTIGLWEVVGTPVELMIGDRYQMKVIYDADGIAQEISTKKLPKISGKETQE